MATEIVVTKWCDVHLYESNEYVKGETRSIPVPGQVKTVDLCDEHDESILGPVRKIYEEYGAKPDAANTVKQSKSAPVICPQCGGEYANTYLMRAHVRRMHPDEADEVLALNGKGYPCTVDGCDHESVNPQGRGAHLRQVHGITGKSKSAQHYREHQLAATA